jgi:iron complex outermembrane receptor protein
MKFFRFHLFLSFRVFSFFTFFLLLSNFVFSQTDSVIGLKEVMVTGTRLQNFSTGHNVITIDSITKEAYSNRYLNDLLSASSSLQVNNYGMGSSSISGRGTSEKRTPVLWNGFNLQSILSAGTDVAQTHSVFFEDVKVQMGGESALFGSGAVGAIVHLNNKTEFNKGLKAEIGNNYGSFNQLMEYAKFSYSNSLVSSSIKAFYNKADNRFDYTANYKTSKLDTVIHSSQTNAQAEQYGVMANTFLKLQNNLSASVNFWYQNSDKHIAPTLSLVAFGMSSQASQVDKVYRGTADITYKKDSLSVTARTGLFYNQLNYYNPDPDYGDSHNKGFSSVSEVELTFSPLSLLKINVGTNFTYEKASASDFPEKYTRNRNAAFASVKLRPVSSFVVVGNVRSEVVSGDFSPVTWSVGAEQQFFKLLTIKANASHNFRFPTFNDLYYKNSYSEGNPDLKAEEGMNYEGGLSFTNTFGGFRFNASSTVYYSDMTNWINWAPKDSLGYVWTVKNIGKANMYGVESSINAQFKVNKGFMLGVLGSHSFTHSEDKETKSQIAYVPEHKYQAGINVNYGKTGLMYRQMFVSKQYSKASKAGEMDSYTTSNIALNHRISTLVADITFELQVNNIFDVDYVCIAGYPMPGRNYMGGLKLSFK